jgi:hypothetical protein
MNTEERYAELRQGLRNLPSRKSPNKQAVEDNLEVIDETLDRGVPVEAIVEFFRQMGWDMATSTFRQHVRAARTARAKAQKDTVEQSSTLQGSSPKRTNRRKVDESSADDTNRNLRPAAEMSPTGADPFDLALASEPELTSDES